MDRSPLTCRTFTWLSSLLVLGAALSSTGCTSLVATGVYLIQGGNVVPADCKELEEHRVVVVCRPPSSSEYSNAGASRQLSRAVTNLLRENVPKIDVVDPREVDQWLDENDWEDFVELGRAVKAERMVVVDMAYFDLYKGKTLYQGNSEITLTVYDLTEGKKSIVYEQALGEVLYPRNSGIPAQDKSAKQFQREYINVLANQIGVYFYKHDAHADFALDAMATR